MIKVIVHQERFQFLLQLENANYSSAVIITDQLEFFEEQAVNILVYEGFEDAIYQLFLPYMDVRMKCYSSRGEEFIFAKDIYYIESYGNEIDFVIEGRILKSKDKLYVLEDTLKNYAFARISKSIIVNLEHIVAIKKIVNGKIQITLENKKVLEVNRTFAKEFVKIIERRL